MAYFPELITPSLGNKEVPYILTFTAFRWLEGACDVAVEKVRYSDKVYENPARGAQEKIKYTISAFFQCDDHSPVFVASVLKEEHMV